MLMRACLVGLVVSSCAAAEAGTILYDDFSDGDADGWESATFDGTLNTTVRDVSRRSLP